MKVLLVLASFGMLVSAKPQYGGGGGGGNYGAPQVLSSYGPPQQVYSSPQGGYSPPQSGYSSPPSGYGIPSGGYGPPPPVVHKHVYVHVPPPEPHYPKARKPYVPPPPPQKHYKIIFIKAPTPPPPEIPDIPAIPPPPETKTLVYVLVKKPEPAPPINIPLPPPTKPSKPEVYFIRYKTPQKEVYGVPQGGYGGPGPAIADIGGDIGSNSVGGDYSPGQDYNVPQY